VSRIEYEKNPRLKLRKDLHNQGRETHRATKGVNKRCGLIRKKAEREGPECGWGQPGKTRKRKRKEIASC